MKRIFVLGIMLMTMIMAYAGPTTEMKGDTLVITVKANGDLAVSNFSDAQKNSTKVKIITANGVKISKSDWDSFFGTNYTTPTFSKIIDLNLALAEFENDDVLNTLGFNSPKLNNGRQLGELVLPESIHETKFSFDDNQSKWTSVVFPNATKEVNKGTTVIAANVFTNEEWIQKLTIGTSVKSIGVQAFNGCKNLKTVDFLYGIQRIDKQAFWGCTGLTQVILPESLEEIGEGAFESCKNITTLRLPNSLKTIRKEAFEGTGIKTVVIPESVELIERQAFGGSGSPLTDVYVLGSNTKAANQAFQPVQYTYDYELKNRESIPNGSVVKLTDFTTKTGFYTILHYPEDAYEKYINKYLRVIGTDKYATSGYPSHANNWVVDAEGNKYAKHNDGHFEGTGDFAGWNNFMFTAKLKKIEKDERLVEGKWYSVCFPFDLTEEQIKNAFGDATEVCEFSGVKSEKDPLAAGKKYITLQFKKPVKDMKAHHPYMIHPGLHHAKNNVIVGVTKDEDTDNDNYAKKLKEQSVSYVCDGITYTFIGNHTAGVNVPKYSYYYYSGNDARWENPFYKTYYTGVVFTPQTAIVKLEKDNGASASTAKQIYYEYGFLNLDDSSTTGINTLPATDTSVSSPVSNNNVYSVYGQIVRRGTTSLEGLPAGLYIVNGKKYVIR